ncbi:MAG: hypothetical protein V4559_00080 [Pseudomonadota bacterium]
MKAPKYQRMEIFEAAIQTAGHGLADPVKGVQITDKGIVAWAGGRAIRMSYAWNQAYGPNGEPMLGGGDWSAKYVEDCAMPPTVSPASRSW